MSCEVIKLDQVDADPVQNKAVNTVTTTLAPGQKMTYYQRVLKKHRRSQSNHSLVNKIARRSQPRGFTKHHSEQK